MKFKINIARLLQSILWAVLAVAAFIGQSTLGKIAIRMYDNVKQLSGRELLDEALAAANTQRYLYQLCWIVFIASIVLFILAIRKVLPLKTRRMIRAAIGRFIKKWITRPLNWIYRKLRVLFGLPEYADSKSKEERSFVFDFGNNEVFRRIMQIAKRERWSDMETNGQKIRFLYAKYVIKLMKSGLRFKAWQTPDQIAAGLKLKSAPKHLFDIYNGARYSDGSFPISDDEVSTAQKLVKK